MPELSYEAIADGLNVCTSQWHRFGTDAVLLAEFSAYRRKERVCDLGTGCGIIPMLMQRKDAPQEVYGVDIQPEAIDQMRRGMAASTGIRSRMHPVCADLKTLWEGAPLGQLDLVTCNPPYKAQGSGILSGMDAEKIARHEVLCTIDDVCGAAARLLRFGGRLCLCQRPERLCDTLCAMRRAGIEPKRIRFVQQRPDTSPWLFLAEGKKGSNPHMTVDPPFLIEGEGGFSPELLRIYHKKENL